MKGRIKKEKKEKLLAILDKTVTLLAMQLALGRTLKGDSIFLFA
jgi:hypothetical protein